MAKLPPHFSDVISLAILDMEVDEVRHAYSAATNSLKNEKKTSEESIRRALRLGPNDPLPEPETDEEGDYLDDVYDRVAEQVAKAQNVLPFVRKAFVIALFYLWERHCNQRMSVGHYDHQKAMAWMAAKGLNLQSSTLSQLQLACNCAKHDRGRSCSDLWKLRPDFFNGVQSEDKASEPRLIITDETFDLFLRAVERR
ncbi:hypothetical protein [Mesorhizobium sp. M8A.F.Ca.ET.167.01.1.1]|uniref:hypothetical protein n=1 Tax=Mesorhizobium sp. M8A.F.Ca.ET.167.01.1.1 TaxID=2563961 RepID=UPI001093CB12|nr:hypothetical protein [Mesorhizobium sp. M8A.F.Ca.ET.167.01.1.1]TGT50817.1 hypothetical protein EN810_20195 [Mesorhizobium sp. M8A.F.Ca.ET.167.01.1.1]